MALRKEAENLLQTGAYGKVRKAVVEAVLKSRTGVYKVHKEYRVGEVADLFLGETDKGQKCLLKVVRHPSENDLLDFEARTLAELHKQTGDKAKTFQKYLPKLLDSFPLIEGGKHRRVNVLDVAEDYVSLAEIHAAYPDGIDPRDAAWMIRRVFEVLGWIHELGYVHGAVLPEHVLVHPTGHGARLVGWSYAVKTGQRLLAVSALRKDMYPPSVMSRKPATPVLDVQLVRECATILLSDKNGLLRADVPKALSAFLTKCKSGKVLDGWDAYREYNEVLKKCYGKREYRAFAMPTSV
jgi:serine/threonine protein kinase